MGARNRHIYNCYDGEMVSMGRADGWVSKACSIEVEGMVGKPDIVWPSPITGCRFVGRSVRRQNLDHFELANKV